MAEAAEFDLIRVKDAFSASRRDDAEILMDQYLTAYTELSRCVYRCNNDFRLLMSDKALQGLCICTAQSSGARSWLTARRSLRAR